MLGTLSLQSFLIFLLEKEVMISELRIWFSSSYLNQNLSDSASTLSWWRRHRDEERKMIMQQIIGKKMATKAEKAGTENSMGTLQ